MTTPYQLIQALRQFMDIAVHRSMRERSHFARATGLSLFQFGILMQLHSCGDCGISEISERFGITAPAASQLVEKLVQGGLIDRSEDPSDRRVRNIALSTKGRSMIETGTRQRYQWVDQLVKRLSVTEREKVFEALSILNEAARKQDQNN